MEKLNKSKIKEMIANYNSLSGEEKTQVTNKIKDNWYELADKFIKLCEQDEVLKNAYDEMKAAKKALSFDVVEDTCFKEVDRVINANDPEFRETLYCFDDKLFAQAKSYYENWEEIQLDFDKKVNKIKSKKAGPKIDAKLKKLEEELKEKRNLVLSYEDCLQNEKLKKLYQSKQGELKQIEEDYNNILREYAKEVALEGAKENPKILCFSQTAFISSKYERDFDINVLKSELDNLRHEALFENEAEIERE